MLTIILLILILLWLITVSLLLFAIVIQPIFFKKDVGRGLGLIVYQVILKKNSRVGEDEAKKDEKAIISVMEQLYSSFSYIKNETGLNRFIKGNPHISLEIVSPTEKDEIHFYVGIPRGYETIMEKQIHGFYPDAEVSRIQDYNAFNGETHIAASWLKLKRDFIFPIRTYQTLETDPLNSLSSALSKIQEHESAVVQILIQKADKNWDKKGAKIGKIMQQGKTFKEAEEEYKGLFTITAIIKAILKQIFNHKSGSDSSQNQFQESNHRLSPLEEELVKSLETKASKNGFSTNVRLMTVAADEERAKLLLQQLEGAFSQFGASELNEFDIKKYKDQKSFVYKFIFRIFDQSEAMLLNSEELTSIYHFPTSFIETPKIKWVKSKKSHPPNDLPKEGIMLGKNVFRGEETIIRIKQEDRRRHVYIIGQTGTGKTSLMKKMIEQDLRSGAGVALLDPNGDFAEEVIGMIPKERAEDLIYFNPQDIERPLGLNIMEARTIEEQDFITQEMISIFYKLVTDPSMIGPIFEHNMRNAMFALMADPDNPGTLVEIPRLFTDEVFRKEIVAKIKDPMVRAFWEKEFPASQKGQQAGDMLGYLISKLGRFIENEMIRNIIGQSHSSFNFREILDTNKILICNLSKGGIGEINSNLLGMIIVSKLQMAAFGRNNIPEDQRKDFYLYLDEFQNFTTDSIATILSEARKYRLDLTLAHQFIGQLDEKIKNAVFGNVGTMTSFRIGAEDAEAIKQKFEPDYTSSDLVNIDNLNAVTTLMVNGQTSKAFNLEVVFADKPNIELQEALKELSRLKFGRNRDMVKQEILTRAKLG